jgi:U3 small nucleolar RNA-associated protein 7
MAKPYLKHPAEQPPRRLRFVPFEDILGVGSQAGFESVIVPGSAKANFDSFTSNPF